MKYLFFITTVSFVFLSACGANKVTSIGDPSSYGWLIGKWERQNVKPGTTSFEEWKFSNPEMLVGIGVTMSGIDTVFVEHLKLFRKDTAYIYTADVKENESPTEFIITSSAHNAFISENPMHDFPKKIAYKRAGNFLKATISGDGKTIDFSFVKK